MSEQDERLLRRAYEAFNARDIEGALATMHPEVDWPNAMEGGRVHGHAEVRAYWERQWGSLDSRVRPLQIKWCPDGCVVATVRQFVRDLAGNVVSDRAVEHRFSIADGLIERMDVLDHWTIRSAGEKDIAALLDLWVTAGSVPSVSDSPEGLARLLATDPQALLVAELASGTGRGSCATSMRSAHYRGAVSRTVSEPTEMLAFSADASSPGRWTTLTGEQWPNMPHIRCSPESIRKSRIGVKAGRRDGRACHARHRVRRGQ